MSINKSNGSNNVNSDPEHNLFDIYSLVESSVIEQYQQFNINNIRWFKNIKITML